MGEKKVSVILEAKDFITSKLRGVRSSFQSWAGEIGKIGIGVAAGLGVAQLAQKLGQFISSSISEAAAAYPKLAAPFSRLQGTFKELKVAGGAALLEVLAPVAPLLQNVLGWGLKLAKQLPGAFDNIRISWSYITSGIAMLPDIGRQAFGALLLIMADFARSASRVLGVLGLDEPGFGLADQLSAAGAALEQKGIRGERATQAARDKRVLELATASHDFGPPAASGPAGGGRRGASPPAEASAADEATTAAERRDAEEYLRREAKQRREAELAAARRGRSTGPTGPRPELDPTSILTNLPGAEAAAGGFTGPLSQGGASTIEFGKAFSDALEPLRAFNEESRTANQLLGDLAGGAIVAVSDSLADLAVNLGATGKMAANPAKAIKAFIADAAKSQGQYHIKRGLATIASGLWPPNPEAIGAGLKEIVAGTALSALGGAIGGGGGGGSSGGGGSRASGSLSPGQFQKDQQALAASRGTVHIHLDPNAIMKAGDPGLQELIAEAVAKGQGRNLIFSYDR